jgi:hypothetical protein
MSDNLEKLINIESTENDPVLQKKSADLTLFVAPVMALITVAIFLVMVSSFYDEFEKIVICLLAIIIHTLKSNNLIADLEKHSKTTSVQTGFIMIACNVITSVIIYGTFVLVIYSLVSYS